MWLHCAENVDKIYGFNVSSKPNKIILADFSDAGLYNLSKLSCSVVVLIQG